MESYEAHRLVSIRPYPIRISAGPGVFFFGLRLNFPKPVAGWNHCSYFATSQGGPREIRLDKQMQSRNQVEAILIRHFTSSFPQTYAKGAAVPGVAESQIENAQLWTNQRLALFGLITRNLPKAQNHCDPQNGSIKTRYDMFIFWSQTGTLTLNKGLKWLKEQTKFSFMNDTPNCDSSPDEKRTEPKGWSRFIQGRNPTEYNRDDYIPFWDSLFCN